MDGFTRHFTYLKNTHVRPKDRKVLLTIILADGINLGMTKMAELCLGTTKSSLEGIQVWYIRGETYSLTLAESWSMLRINDLWRHPWAMEQPHRLTDRNLEGSHGGYVSRSI